jgi:hypothetical protein
MNEYWNQWDDLDEMHGVVVDDYALDDDHSLDDAERVDDCHDCSGCPSCLMVA